MLLSLQIKIYNKQEYFLSQQLDVDECAADSSLCDTPNGACEDTDGSYNCICNSGYEFNLDGVTCGSKFIVINQE